MERRAVARIFADMVGDAAIHGVGETGPAGRSRNRVAAGMGTTTAESRLAADGASRTSLGFFPRELFYGGVAAGELGEGNRGRAHNLRVVGDVVEDGALGSDLDAIADL